MTPRIQEHVSQRVPHLARGAKHVKVVAVHEHGPAQAEHTVHGASKASAEGFHSGAEIALAPCFDDRMQLVVLDRIVDETKAAALACRSEAALELAYQADRPQRRQPAPHLQSDMAGKARRERR